MTFRKHALWPALAFLLSSCGKPGTTPNGQLPLVTLTRLESVVERFNQAKVEQVQVIAMFSPT